MAGADEQYFVYENRLASFRGPQPVAKGRVSKALAWPHVALSPVGLAKAGFFFEPHPKSPDNVVCFLCAKSLDGWEKNDNPLEEHLKHSPTCGWALMAAIEAGLGNYGKVHPLDPVMIEARKATFAGRWPYESKKGFKCKTKKLVEAGWKYTPSLDADDMTTCAYCQLALEGWESGDNPFDEHYRREPNCPFFTLISQYPAPKKGRAKGVRASKASRLSVQSVATVATAISDLASAADITADHDDSIMTTASTMTQGGKKTARGRKAAATKGRKTKVKKDEAVEILEDEPQVQEPPPQKPARGRKRASDAMEDAALTNAEAPEPKRRATRVKASDAVETASTTSSLPDTEMGDAVPAKAAGKKKARVSTAKSTRKVSQSSVRSQASTAPLRANLPDDDEIDRQLEADLERYQTDPEDPVVDSGSERPKAPARAKGRPKKATTARKASTQPKAQSEHYAMFDPTPLEPTEADIEAEFKALQAEMELEQPAATETLIVPKKGRKAGTRKASKQTKKAKEPIPQSDPVDQEVQDDAQPVEAVQEPAPEKTLQLPAPPPSADRLPQPPATPRSHTTPSASARQAAISPSQSPQSSDAENRPPSSKAAASDGSKRVALAPINVTATPLRSSSPARRNNNYNMIAGLQSTTPWRPADLDLLFSPSSSDANGDKENGVARLLRKGSELTSPERRMTVEEWIYHNAGLAEQKLKHECEAMVSAFEREGTRAIRVLEGLVVE
ncbi:BIR-domain-containing protein [Madurella fahalii]|uniref:BIR-domain-containing protein n=1 Tax=Madurella fahalii TaxID=1157608 RepID=A0ABQ0GPA2_9PEZI